jgi:hypothetical protein
MALGAMTAIREAEVTIPDDIALMGFDDIFAARFVTPPILGALHWGKIDFLSAGLVPHQSPKCKFQKKVAR